MSLIVRFMRHACAGGGWRLTFIPEARDFLLYLRFLRFELGRINHDPLQMDIDFFSHWDFFFQLDEARKSFVVVLIVGPVGLVIIVSLFAIANAVAVDVAVAVAVAVANANANVNAIAIAIAIAIATLLACQLCR